MKTQLMLQLSHYSMLLNHLEWYILSYTKRTGTGSSSAFSKSEMLLMRNILLMKAYNSRAPALQSSSNDTV